MAHLQLIVDNDSTERTASEGNPEVYEPRVTWEEVYYTDGLQADENIRHLNRRQEAWDGDPEEYDALSMESVDGWVGECAG